MKINKILFYYPSKITGGAEYLFKRCSEYLAEIQSQYEIFYADYSDGFVRKNITTDKVHFIEVGHDKKVYVEDGTIVILQLNMIYQLYDRIIFNKEKSTCLFWNLHALNIKGAIFAKNRYWISKYSRRKLGESLFRLSELNVVKFMNHFGSYAFFNELLTTSHELELLPNIAPIKESTRINSFERVSENVWKFCWLGRLDVEKSRNIETYMNELEVLNKRHPLSLSLIGRGPNEDYLMSIANKYSYPIEFVGEKREEELDTFIKGEVEIGLASGTSAFEFALRGKPVIMEWVIDRVYGAGERKTYIYTHEDEQLDFSPSGMPIRKKQDCFEQKAMKIMNCYQKVTESEYQFVLSKSVDNCCNKLVNTIHQIEHLDQVVVEKEVKLIERIVNKARKRIKFIYKLTHPFKR